MEKLKLYSFWYPRKEQWQQYDYSFDFPVNTSYTYSDNESMEYVIKNEVEMELKKHNNLQIIHIDNPNITDFKMEDERGQFCSITGQLHVRVKADIETMRHVIYNNDIQPEDVYNNDYKYQALELYDRNSENYVGVNEE